jgi:hypothetical protein
MYAIRDGDGDIVGLVRAQKGVTPNVPAGGSYCWAEPLLWKAAAALFIKRLVDIGRIIPRSKYQKAIAVRTIRAVMELKENEEQTGEIYKLVNGTIKNVLAGESVNQKWSFALNDFHHGFTSRMLGYYAKAVTDAVDYADLPVTA